MGDEDNGGGGSLAKKLLGVLTIFGTVALALFWWRRRGAGEDSGEQDLGADG